MKKLGAKFGIIMLVVVCFLAMTLSACKPKKKPSNSASFSSSSTSSVSSEVVEKKAVDRSAYNISDLSEKYNELRLSELLNASKQGTVTQYAVGYTVGDLINSVIKYYNDTAMPSGSNLGAVFGFTLYDDGYWYANSSNVKVNVIANKILSFRVDEFKKLDITKAELETWKDDKLASMLGYDKSTNKLISDLNPLVGKLINSTVGDWVELLNNLGNNAAIKLKEMCGDVLISDVVTLKNAPLYFNDYVVANVLGDYICGISLDDNAVKIKLLDAWAKTERGKTSELLAKPLIVDGIDYTVSSALSLFSKLETNNASKIIGVGVTLHFSNLFDQIMASYSTEVDAAVFDYCDNELVAAFTDEMTIGSAIKRYFSESAATSKKDAALAICFDYIKYVDFKYGENQVVGTYTLSDILTYFNKLFSSSSSGAQTVKDELLIALEQEFLKLKQEYVDLNAGASLTVTLERLFNERKNTVLNDDDIAFLKSIDSKKLFAVQTVGSVQIASIDALIDDVLTLSLYDLFVLDVLNDANSDIRKQYESVLNEVTVLDIVKAFKAINKTK